MMDLSMVRNTLKDNGQTAGLTCMQLAVYRNDPKMFNFILESKRQVQWEYGTVACSLVRICVWLGWAHAWLDSFSFHALAGRHLFGTCARPAHPRVIIAAVACSVDATVAF